MPNYELHSLNYLQDAKAKFTDLWSIPSRSVTFILSISFIFDEKWGPIAKHIIIQFILTHNVKK